MGQPIRGEGNGLVEIPVHVLDDHGAVALSAQRHRDAAGLVRSAARRAVDVVEPDRDAPDVLLQASEAKLTRFSTCRRSASVGLR